MMKPRGILTCLLVAVAAVAVADGAARAGAPLSKLPTPGWYRMSLGDFEVTALSDGTVELPADTLLTGTTKAKVEAALKKDYLKAPVELSVNCYLINTGTKLVLID